MKNIKKHPLAIAWDNWLESEVGQSALDMSILSGSGMKQYLENRLHHAFQAGIAAQKEYHHQMSRPAPITKNKSNKVKNG